MFDYNAFIEYIRERGVKLKAVARAMGMTPSTLYRKATGKSDFTRNEIQKCCDFFGVKELNYIFFAEKVSYT